MSEMSYMALGKSYKSIVCSDELEMIQLTDVKLGFSNALVSFSC